VPYRPYLSTQLSDAYDVYLELCRRVDHKIKHALGHDTPNWHLRNCCPACFYKLEDEPKQKFSCFISMDGNNSLRRMGADIRKYELRPDSRTLTSDRWLKPDEVNRFKDEVKSSVRLLNPLRFLLTMALAVVQREAKSWWGCRWLGRRTVNKFWHMCEAVAECRTWRAKEDVRTLWWNRNFHCIVPPSICFIGMWHDKKWWAVGVFFLS
jgi:hypothetical protein